MHVKRTEHQDREKKIEEFSERPKTHANGARIKHSIPKEVSTNLTIFDISGAAT